MQTPKLVALVKQHRYFLTLLFIAVILASANYKPGTWLSGWDTLHPEFNLWLYFKRIFFGVWQEHQGLGAVASQAHAAELPRMLVYFLLYVLLPESLVRYSYILLCLVLGPLGVYAFLRKGLFHDKDTTFSKVAAFAGGLFYLLNLGTLQHFYVPLEMFTTHYALLGWQLLFFTLYVRNKQKINLLLFAVVTIFAAPMAHTATLFYAYFFGLVVFSIGIIFSYHNKQPLVYLRRAVLLLVITLALNAFWLLPNLYFIANHAREVEESKIHRLFSDEAFASNQAAGTFTNTAILKNFLFDWGERKADGNFGNLMDQWNAHLRQPLVLPIGYALFAIVLLGMGYSFWKKEPLRYALLLLFIASLFFLINANPPFTQLFNFLRSHSALFKEALRFPFTKFSILLLFCYASFFSLGMYALLAYLNRFRPRQIIRNTALGILIISFVYYMAPGFEGYFIDPAMKVKIPKAYFAMFDWFSKQGDGSRVADFPVHSFWGWTYYDWGYQGAGFLWFGIPQPLLNREFDRWNKYNEQYYREMSAAVYAKDGTRLDKLFDKYQIRWLILDDSVIDPGNKEGSTLYRNEIKQMLAVNSRVKRAATFGPKLTVYEVAQKVATKTFLDVPPTFSHVEPSFRWSDIDMAFLEKGTYFSRANDTSHFALPGSEITYVFRSLLGQQDSVNPAIVSFSNESYSLRVPLTKQDTLASLLGNRALILPDLLTTNVTLSADVYVENTNRLAVTLIYTLPGMSQSQEKPSITVPLNTSATNGPFLLVVNGNSQFLVNPNTISGETLLGHVSTTSRSAMSLRTYANASGTAPTVATFTDIQLRPERCGVPDIRQSFGAGVVENGKGFKLYAQNANACLKLPLSDMPVAIPKAKNQPYLMKVQFENQTTYTGKVAFCVYKIIDGTCVSPEEASESNSTSVRYKEVTPVDVSSLGIEFFFDTTGLFNYQDVVLKNVQVSFMGLTSEEHISPEQLASVVNRSGSQANDLASLQGKAVEVLGKYTEPQGTSNIFQISRRPKSCNLFSVGSINRKVVNDASGNYIRYTSKKDSSCDYFSFQDAEHDKSYMLLVESRNISGLPLRLCVSNQVSRRCDLYTVLPEGKNFTQSMYLIPSSDSLGRGYDINLNNYAVGTVETINDLTSIKLIEFPYEWIRSLNTQDTARDPTMQSGVTTSDVTSYNRVVYGAKLSFAGDRPSLLELGQAYEDGWVALAGKNLFTLHRLNPHVLVNNWANGWIINPTSGKQQIFIIFVPQILEFAGLLVTGTLLGYYLLTWQRKTHHE